MSGVPTQDRAPGAPRAGPPLTPHGRAVMGGPVPSFSRDPRSVPGTPSRPHGISVVPRLRTLRAGTLSPLFLVWCPGRLQEGWPGVLQDVPRLRSSHRVLAAHAAPACRRWPCLLACCAGRVHTILVGRGRSAPPTQGGPQAPTFCQVPFLFFGPGQGPSPPACTPAVTASPSGSRSTPRGLLGLPA